MSNVLASREEGELLLARVRVSGRHLEDLLETLASLSFPVNPDLSHAGLESVVSFPVYAHRLPAVEEAVRPLDLAVETLPMAQAIRA